MIYTHYPHNPSKFSPEINQMVSELEENLKIYTERLAQWERNKPSPHFQENRERVLNAIRELKKLRTELSVVDWL